MRAVLAAGALALALASAPAMAEFEVLQEARGWVIGRDVAARTCMAYSAPNHQGTRLAFVWTLGDATWAVVLQNPTWKLKKGQRIPGRVYVDRDLLVNRRLDVVDADKVSLPIRKGKSGESDVAFNELSAGLELRVEWSGGSRTRIGLVGSAAALTSLGACAGQVQEFARQTQPPAREPQVAGYTFEMVPREEAIVMATRFMSIAGLGAYELARDQSGDTVVFQLQQGGVFALRAARGNTAPADDYVGKMTGVRSKACRGTFGSIVEKLPSTDGSVIRRLITKCDTDGAMTHAVSTILRKPDGMLVDATVIEPSVSAADGFTPVPGERSNRSRSAGGDGYVDAALQIAR